METVDTLPDERSVVIPFLPDSIQKSWEHGKYTHRNARKRITKYLDENQIEIEPFDPKPEALYTDIIFVLPTRRRRDLDNLKAGTKIWQDVIMERLGLDDNIIEMTLVSKHYEKGVSQTRFSLMAFRSNMDRGEEA